MAKMSKTWWGRLFIEALEQFLDQGRLRRGRSYRSDHRILSFNINNNIITATVRGNINHYFGVYEEPHYKIRITITTIPKTEWTHVIKKLSSNAAWISKLLMNEMPDNIENAFTTLKLSLLPDDDSDFKTKCSCPDWANPCKHIAGVYYRVASILDTDPFLMFQLRGLSKEKLQKELSKLPLGQALLSQLIDTEEITPQCVDSIYTKPEKMMITEPISLKEFWSGKKNQCSQIEKTGQSNNISAILIKKQGDFPPFWQRDNSFIEAMENIYAHIKQKNRESL